jgi:hypothetical protein
MYLPLIIFFLSLAIIYLCGLFDNYKKVNLSFSSAIDQSLIEHLTKFKTKTKNYNTTPGQYQSFNRNIHGQKQGDNVYFYYEFPLIEKYHHVFTYTLNPLQTSHEVDVYGIPKEITDTENNDSVKLSTQLPEKEFSNLLKQGGWYYESNSQECGVDFPYLVNSYRRFTAPIAISIYEALISKGADNYFNRVQASLNFVQFIPYGIPKFDTPEWYYHELATPPECFILNYGDCDTKSLFLASILSELIPKENIILVSCIVQSGNKKIAGGHMMLAVSDLGVEGEYINHMNKDFVLLETTAPWIIGKTDWNAIHIKKIYTLV